MTISLWHSDLVFDSTRQSLYAVVGNDTSLLPKIVAVAAVSGQVQDLVAPSDPPVYAPVDPVQGTLSLSAQAQICTSRPPQGPCRVSIWRRKPSI